jgi:hypothetical protein
MKNAPLVYCLKNDEAVPHFFNEIEFTLRRIPEECPLEGVEKSKISLPKEQWEKVTIKQLNDRRKNK